MIVFLLLAYHPRTLLIYVVYNSFCVYSDELTLVLRTVMKSADDEEVDINDWPGIESLFIDKYTSLFRCGTSFAPGCVFIVRLSPMT